MSEITEAATPAGVSPQTASRTVVAQALGRAVSLLAVVGSTAIVAREIGVTEYADWATVLSLVSLVAFALDPGVSPVIVRRLSQDPAQAPRAEAVAPLRLALGAVALVVIVAVTVGLRGGGSALLAAALGAQVLPRALVLNATPWLQLDHRLHRQTALEAMSATTGLALLALVAAAGGSPPLLGLAGFTGPTLVLAVLMRRELRITPSRRLDVPGPQRERVRSVAREVAPLALALLLVATYTRAFVAFLNAGEDSQTVARFLFAFQFVEQLIVGAGIVAGAVLPLLALRGRTTHLLEDDVTQRLLCALAAAGALVSAAIIALATPLTHVIGGPGLAPAGRYLQLLAPMGSVIMPTMVLAYVYVALSQSHRYLLFNGVGLAANLVANAALTLTVGALATARISWGTEALVLALAMSGVVLRGRAGRRTGALMLALVSASVAAAELAGNDVLPPFVAAVLLVAAVTLLARGPLVWLVTAILPSRAPRPADPSTDVAAAPAPSTPLRRRRPRVPRPLAALLAAVLLLGVAWTLVTPAWESPDENSHFAEVQYIGETGHLPGDPKLPVFSTEQGIAATQSGADQAAAQIAAKMSWSPEAFEAWQRREDQLTHAQRSDGGGPNPAASNPPLYYLYETPAYVIGKGLGIFARLELTRLASLLWLLVAVAGAWLLAGEVFARDRVKQLCTAGAVALAPMMQFISASVTPDSMLFAGWALTMWLGVRLIKRGATPATAAALFAVAGASCVVKATSYAILPAVVLALVIALVRGGTLRRPRLAVSPVVAAAAGALLTLGVYVVWTRVTGRAVSTQVATVSGSTHGSLREMVSYVWQYYLPRVPWQIDFPTIAPTIPVYDIELKGVWGAFGWLEVRFSDPVFLVLAAITVAVGILAFAGLWRDRRAADWGVVAFLALVVVGLMAGLHLTEYRQIKSGAVNFIQGRYLLPLAPLAGLALTRALAWLPRPRLAGAVAASLGALLILDLFSLGLVLVRFYA